MKTNEIKEDLLFSSIYENLKLKKELHDKINQLAYKMESLEKEVRDLNEAVNSTKDIESYRKFFELYDIEINNDIFRVQDIFLDQNENKSIAWWRVKYKINGINCDTTRFLQKYMNLLLEKGAKLKRREN